MGSKITRDVDNACSDVVPCALTFQELMVK